MNTLNHGVIRITAKLLNFDEKNSSLYSEVDVNVIQQLREPYGYDVYAGMTHLGTYNHIVQAESRMNDYITKQLKSGWKRMK